MEPKKQKPSRKGKIALGVSAAALATAAVLFWPAIENSRITRKPVRTGQAIKLPPLDSAYDSISSRSEASSSASSYSGRNGERESSLVYTVERGDNLASIIRKQLGLKGNEAYTALENIQKLNNFPADRDIYCYINGKLYWGQDGIADIIYPGEKIILR